MNPSLAADSIPPEPQGYAPRSAAAVLAAMILVTVTLSLATMPFGQVADPVRKSFGIGDLEFSMLIGLLFALPSMLMSVGGGWLSDRFSRRRLLTAAMLVWTAGALWTAFATEYWQLAAGRLLVASAAGIKFPLAMTWIADAYPPERRGKAVGLLFVVLGVGPAIGASISGLVLHAAQAGHLNALPGLAGLEPWRQAITVLALTNLLPLPWIAMLCEQRPANLKAAESAPGGHGGHGGPVGAVSRLPLGLVVAMVVGSALFSLADNANLSWLPTVLSRQHGFDAQQVGFTFGLIATVAGSLGPILGGYLDGWAYRRWGSTGRLRSCAIAALLCAPCLLAFASSNHRLLVGALVLSGIISMTAMTLSFLAIQAALPPGRRGLGSGFANAVTNLASASAPTLVAFTSDRLPSGPAALGTGIAIVSVLTFSITAVIYTATARRLTKLEQRGA